MRRPSILIVLATLALGGCGSSASSSSTPTKTETPKEVAEEYARAARCQGDVTRCQEERQQEALEEDSRTVKLP